MSRKPPRTEADRDGFFDWMAKERAKLRGHRERSKRTEHPDAQSHESRESTPQTEDMAAGEGELTDNR